jgi:cation diffusion facilitator family transporter
VVIKEQNEIKFLERNHLKARLIAISLSFIVGIFLMAAKFYVYRLTQSSAILSDALESIINIVASAFALASILFAARPPDESHPYGHGKIEYFSAGFEGALIVFASFGIFKFGLSRIINPQELSYLRDGLLMLLGISIINLIMGIVLIRVGKHTSSLILVADGKHLLTDVYTSGGVLLGLYLVQLTGINILITGGKLVRSSFADLMHTSDPGLLKEVSNVLAQHRKDTWIDIHELRAWRSGNHIYFDLHLILPRDFTLERSHSEAKKLENIIIKYFKGKASVLIHMDPCMNPDCPICSRHLCEMRIEEMKDKISWDRKTITLKGGAGERLMNDQKDSNKKKAEGERLKTED